MYVLNQFMYQFYSCKYIYRISKLATILTHERGLNTNEVFFSLKESLLLKFPFFCNQMNNALNLEDRPFNSIYSKSRVVHTHNPNRLIRIDSVISDYLLIEMIILLILIRGDELKLFLFVFCMIYNPFVLNPYQLFRDILKIKRKNKLRL